MAEDISYEDIEKNINDLFIKNRKRDELDIDLTVYTKLAIREVSHYVICKDTCLFDLWVKLKDPENLAIVCNGLSEFYSTSKFTVTEYDELLSYIKCDISEVDAGAIKTKLEVERTRYLKRKEVIQELEAKHAKLKDEFSKTMTILNEKLVQLQERYEKKLREINNERVVEKNQLDNLMLETPKKYQESIEETAKTLAALKKCSHGFMYESSIFAKP